MAGRVTISGDRIFPDYKLWLEATFVEKLPPIQEFLAAKSYAALKKLLGSPTSMASGYDGGGGMARFYYWTLEAHDTVLVYLAEIELSGINDGELRVWTGSAKLPK